MNRTLTLIVLLAALPLPLPVAAAAAPPAPRAIAGFNNPESVLISGDHRFVSNIGATLDPTGKDGDGYVSELDAEGRVLDAHAFPAIGSHLDAPKGMAMAGGRLYVADIDRVVAEMQAYFEGELGARSDR